MCYCHCAVVGNLTGAHLRLTEGECKLIAVAHACAGSYRSPTATSFFPSIDRGRLGFVDSSIACCSAFQPICIRRLPVGKRAKGMERPEGLLGDQDEEKQHLTLEEGICMPESCIVPQQPTGAGLICVYAFRLPETWSGYAGESKRGEASPSRRGDRRLGSRLLGVPRNSRNTYYCVHSQQWGTVARPARRVNRKGGT